jgi:hypothetical protein
MKAQWKKHLRALQAGSLLVGGALTGSLFLGTLHAAAATLTVTDCSGSSADTGSLPYAVAHASSGDTINFTTGLSCPASSPIALMTTLTINQSLTIAGPGASTMAVSFGGTVIEVTAAAAISGLTVENGAESGIKNNHGTVTITDSTLSDNGAMVDGGGGIYNAGGTVTVIGSTLVGNNGYTSGGGGIFNEGGTVTLTDSTLSNNSAHGPGGGIYNNGTVTITDSTVFGNGSAQAGGGIFTSDQLNIGATILGGSTGGDCDNYNAGILTDEGYNISDDSTCGFTATGSTNDSSTLDASLSPLQDNGGPTETILPSWKSPVDIRIPKPTVLGSVTVCPRSDQRGVASFRKCGIGAVEGGFLITTTSLPPATPGVDYNPVTLTTQDARNAVTIAWAAISLPQGMNLSADGVLSGTPSNSLSAGLTSVRVKATETVGTFHRTVKTTIPLTIT